MWKDHPDSELVMPKAKDSRSSGTHTDKLAEIFLGKLLLQGSEEEGSCRIRFM